MLVRADTFPAAKQAGSPALANGSDPAFSFCFVLLSTACFMLI